MADPNSGAGFSGFQQPNTGGSDYNAQSFLIQSLLSRISTATVVKVVACTNSGGLSAVGFVDILPLVNQIDGAGNAMPHGVVYRCPYFRIQGGANAVIIDPQPGDLGIAIFADRDISSVTANKGQANPGSRRRFDMADALYLGGVLNGVPSQFVRFSAAGIEISASTAITLEAPMVSIFAGTSVTVTTPTFTVNGATVLNGPLSQGTGAAGGSATMQGPMTVVGDVTAAGTSLHSHTHSDPQGGSTGGPN